MRQPSLATVCIMSMCNHRGVWGWEDRTTLRKRRDVLGKGFRERRVAVSQVHFQHNVISQSWSRGGAGVSHARTVQLWRQCSTPLPTTGRLWCVVAATRWGQKAVKVLKMMCHHAQEERPDPGSAISTLSDYSDSMNTGRRSGKACGGEGAGGTPLLL